jgi:cyclic pyranopterin phosphate synthase
MSELTHFDSQGASRMVDVAAKPVSFREARATARIAMQPATLALVGGRQATKGDVFEVARLAGIMAAKRTGELIPLCHQVPLDSVRLDFRIDGDRVQIEACSRATARTGVEMEALVAVATAALTVYDMLKAVDRGMVIEQIQLEEKSGGASGHYRRAADHS